MFFNNCRLANVSLIKFEIKHSEQVARCLNHWKNTNDFGNSRLITLLFAFVSKMVSLNNRRMTFTHDGIPMSLMQRIVEYLMALTDFDLLLFLRIHKRPSTSKGKRGHLDKMNIAKSL